MTNVESVLDRHEIRKTSFRKILLKLFYDVRSSLTVEEISRKVGATYDKATIYRTLDLFEKEGLIHLVPDKSNLVRYALSRADYCSNHKNHAHFICTKCNETFCLDEIEPPKIESNNGFTIRTSKLTLIGVCPNCTDTTHQ